MKRSSFPSIWRRRGLLSFVALLLALALPMVVLASDVNVAVVDVTVPVSSVTLAPGGSSAIVINMSVTGNQVGTATFEVYRDWTLSGGMFTGSNPQEFTVAPRAGGDPATTFSTSGTVTVAAGQSNGTFTLAVGAFDITNSNETGAKLAAGSSSNYQITVETPAPSDTTAPVITPNITGTLGDNGWYVSDVTVSWSVVDNESAITSPACEETVINSDTTGITVSCSATSAGGTATESVTIKRDATAPTDIAFSGGGIVDGGQYYYDFVPAGPTSCSADGAVSGLLYCDVSGYSTAVGTQTVTATAKDNAGNVGTAQMIYTVNNWTLTGFYNPVTMGSNVWNTVKGGSTVPLKFEIFAGTMELTGTSAIRSFSTRTVSCTTAMAEDAVDFVTTGGTSLRYDASAGQFVQNWQTPRQAGKCFEVTMLAQDGTTLKALFWLK